MKKNEDALFHLADVHPLLRPIIESGRLEVGRIKVGVPVSDDRRYNMENRNWVGLVAGEQAAVWEVPSLRELFRGDKPAPTLGDYPEEYNLEFAFIESHVLTFCGVLGDKTDGEFEEVYSNLRRRPDGRTLNELHHFLWQVAAALLGLKPLSAGEFDAIFGRLTRSARTFKMSGSSRNYMACLHGQFD